MKNKFLIYLVLSACFYLGSCSPAPTTAIDVLIENIQIINSENATIDIGHVLIKDGKIIDIKNDLPNAIKVQKRIDGTGKFLIPGLIDSHVHLANPAGLNGKFFKKYPKLLEAYYQQLPKSYLYYGFTTVIDPNNYAPKIINRLQQQNIRPDIYTCGEQLEIAHGFMMAETPKDQQLTNNPYFLHDHFNSEVTIPDSLPKSLHTPDYLVARIVQEQQGICVKTLFENGFGGTEKVTWEMPTRQIIREVVKAAHQEGVPVMLHANSFESQQFALDTDVDIIAHGMWHWGLLSEYLTVTKLPTSHKKLLQQLAAKQTGYQPTFRVIAGQRDVFDDTFIENKELQHCYPQEFLAWLKTDEGKWQQALIRHYAKGFFDSLNNPEIVELMQTIVDKVSVSAKELEKHNGNLLFGSDTPASNAHTNPPGYNGYLEIMAWYQAGIPLATILKAATINNAKAYNLEHLYGSIKKGKSANMLILNKNPLETIEAYQSITHVIIQGKSINRGTLSAHQ